MHSMPALLKPGDICCSLPSIHMWQQYRAGGTVYLSRTDEMERLQCGLLHGQKCDYVPSESCGYPC